MFFFERTWAEIDFNAARYNLTQIQSRLQPGTSVMAVVKADAYGCGSGYIKKLISWGVEDFAVSNLEEAEQVRQLGAKGVVLILGPTPPRYAAALSRLQVTQTLFSLSYAKELSAAAKAAGVAVRCHVKVDSGMGRIGFDAFAVTPEEELRELAALPGLSIVGAFTHFSSADDISEEGRQYTLEQIERFDRFAASLEQFTGALPEVHAQNSAAIINYPELRYRFVRAGIILYGLPVDSFPGKELDLTPVMSVKSNIAMLKSVPEDRSIGYSRKYTTRGSEVIATIPIGYADGYSRGLSGKTEVLVRGYRAPVLGNICMDQLMADVSGVPGVQEGDAVTVVGRDGSEEITFGDLAEKLGTIHYELCCAVGKRVPRVYKEFGKVVSTEDYYSWDADKQVE